MLPMDTAETEEQQRWWAFRFEAEKAAIASVKDKLANGEYALEDAPCFCGASDDKELRTKDRLGIPHRIVICQSCALVRANPRPTADAYRQFYNNEYRQFNYRWLDRCPTSWEDEYELIRQKEYQHGCLIVEKVINEDIGAPKVVIDIGCYQGGVLDRFKEMGAKTYGVEFNDDARAACNARDHKVYSTLEELVASGVKADFVILQDVIEHFIDLKDVQKLHELLAPDGYVYIFTPGMFRTDPHGFWQLAHTWYFVANTFGWVMEELGFTPTYIDEDITSFWQYQGMAQHAEPPKDWAEYIIDEAEGKEERRLPPFGGVCKFTKKLLYGNMRRNFALKVPDVHAITDSKCGPVIIIGGGPSIDSQVDVLKNLASEGIQIIAISRMYPWCLKNGIAPDYVVSLDCSEEQEKGFETIDPMTTHLMASVTRPEITQSILDKGAPCYLFDSRDDRKIKGLRRDAGYNACTVINSGGTVVITCISVAFTLGFTALHIFGFDCMMPDAQHFHAEGIAGKSVDQHILPVDIEGEKVMTTPSFMEFARQALDIFSIAHDEGFLTEVKIYGDSLISKMWDCQWHEDEVAA